MAASSKAAAGGGAPQPARMAASWTCGVCSQSELTVSPLGSCGVCDLEICRRCQGAASTALYMGSTERFRWTYQPGQPVRFRLLAGACLTSARLEPLPGFSPYWCMECCREDLVADERGRGHDPTGHWSGAGRRGSRLRDVSLPRET